MPVDCRGRRFLFVFCSCVHPDHMRLAGPSSWSDGHTRGLLPCFLGQQLSLECAASVCVDGMRTLALGNQRTHPELAQSVFCHVTADIHEIVFELTMANVVSHSVLVAAAHCHEWSSTTH